MNTRRDARCVAFAISGFLAAFAGALFVHHQNGLQLDSYSRGGEPRGVHDGRDRRARLHTRRARSARSTCAASRGRSRWSGRSSRPAPGCSSCCSCSPAGSAPRSPTCATCSCGGWRGVAASSPCPRSPAVGAGRRAARAPPRPARRRRADRRRCDRRCAGSTSSTTACQVLFGVDLDVAAGEIVALLGTNGSGKSTVLRAVSGLVRSRHGTSHHRRTRRHARARPNASPRCGVGQAPGGDGVFPSLTVARAPAPRALAGARPSRRRRRRRATALERFPRARDADARAARATSRAASSRCSRSRWRWSRRPRLLLVDELTLGLAPDGRRTASQRSLRELRDAGTTIVVVEQSLDLALELADRAYFLEHGDVRFEGATGGAARPPRPRARRVPRRRRRRRRRPSRRRTADAPADAVAAPRLARRRDRRSGSAASSRSTTSRSTVGARRDRRVRRRQRRGQDHAVRRACRASSRPTPARSRSGPATARRSTSTAPARRTGARASGSGRSFQDGRLFPALTVGETIAVALEHAVRVRDPVAAALHLPAVARSEAAVAHARRRARRRCSGSATYADAFLHELSTGTRRIVDLACVLAHEPSVLLLDEPSSGIAQREAEALAPLLVDVRDTLGDQPARDRARPAAAAGGRRAPRGARLRPGRRRRAIPTRCSRDPAVARSFLGPTGREPVRAARRTRDDLRRAPADATRRDPRRDPGRRSLAGVSGDRRLGRIGRRANGRTGAAHLRRGEGAGQGGRLGPELRHHAPAGSRCRAATRRRASSRGRAATTAARPRRASPRTRSRSRSTRPSPTCSQQTFFEETGSDESLAQGARHHPGVRRLLLRALRAVRPQDRARHGEGERRARRRRRGEGRRDQGRDRGEGVRVVRRSGPDRPRTPRSSRRAACCASATA